jgi:hypothetical protein
MHFVVGQGSLVSGGSSNAVGLGQPADSRSESSDFVLHLMIATVCFQNDAKQVRLHFCGSAVIGLEGGDWAVWCWMSCMKATGEGLESR